MVVGSIAIGVWIARLVFVVLIVQALIEQRYRVVLVAGAVAGVAWLVVDRFNPFLVTPLIAMIDIALVFIVLGRDIRLN